MSVVDLALSPIRNESGNPSKCWQEQDQVGTYYSESILIYLIVPDSVIPMRILDSDSIASVKLRIQTQKGFGVKKQKLVFAGRTLDRNNCSLVRDYGLSDGNVLHLVLKLSDLIFINIKTCCGREFGFQTDRFRNVGYLKRRIVNKDIGVNDLDNQDLFCEGKKLDDDRVINDICKNNDAIVHLLVQKSAKVRAKHVQNDLELSVSASINSQQTDENVRREREKRSELAVPKESPARDFLLEPILVHPEVKLPRFVWDMISSTLDGFAKGHQPIRSSEGTGGTYFMQHMSGDKFVSVFKPIDEEPNAINNPRGLPVSSNGEGLKRGTEVGGGALREAAAYILDHPRSGLRLLTGELAGFAGVPPTAMVQCLHKGFNHPDGYYCTSTNVKIGSLQMFMKNDGSCEDIGPGAYPVKEVHKISVLDIRLANADRHAGNILWKKDEDGQIKLIPIDHGYCLPEIFEDCTFEWLYWPQAEKPYSPETVAYINSLDAEQDIALMKFYGWEIPSQCARTLRISTLLLKKGAARGLTPFAIGSMMCRETLNEESFIEEVVREAERVLLPGMCEADFLCNVSQILDFRLDKLTR